MLLRAKAMEGRPETIHAFVRWNPKEHFHEDAPESVRLWCEKLESYQRSKTECFTWWGKISVSGELGLDEAGISQLTRQIDGQLSAGVGETHLYIYSSDFSYRPPSLHVGHLKEVRTEGGVDLLDPHVPSYYEEVKHRIPFWFRLTDIRRLPLNRLDSLLFAGTRERFDPNQTFPVPRLVVEFPPRDFFSQNVLHEIGWTSWWKEVLYGAPEGFPPIDRVVKISEGSRDHDFEGVFRHFIEEAEHVKVVDPYVSEHPENLVTFLQFLKNPGRTVVLVSTRCMPHDRARVTERLADQAARVRPQLKSFRVSFDARHDRWIETENWEIHLGRGLDFLDSNGRGKECNIFYIRK
jgi:hypothetical protein